MQELDPSIQTVWAVQYGLFALGTSALIFFYELIHLFESTVLPLPFGLNALVVLAVGGGGGWLWARLRRRYWRFDIGDEEVRLRHGVLTRIATIVPLRRIQHLDVSQNVLEREWELARLVMYTAGTKQNSVVLPGLPLEEARSIRDRIREYVLSHRE